MVSRPLRVLTDRRSLVLQIFVYFSSGDHPTGAYPMDCDGNGKKSENVTHKYPRELKKISALINFYFYSKTPDVCQRCFSVTL